MTVPRVDPTITFGHILQLFATLVVVFGSGFALHTDYSSRITIIETREEVKAAHQDRVNTELVNLTTAITRRVNALEMTTAARSEQIDNIEKTVERIERKVDDKQEFQGR